MDDEKCAVSRAVKHTAIAIPRKSGSEADRAHVTGTVTTCVSTWFGRADPGKPGFPPPQPRT